MALSELTSPGVLRRSGFASCALVAALAGVASAAIAETFIAGTAPERRPDGAPKITTRVRPAGWEASATAGIVTPFPPSVLRVLNDQGGWFTPFTERGMTGPYDIRGLHAPTGGRPAAK